MTDKNNKVYELEEGNKLMLDFSKLAKVAANCPDVLPVAVQNADTKEVIVIAYVNQEALELSIKSRIATFWSTSRNELWIKGASSGNHFELLEIRINCEQNSLVYIVRPKGNSICHTFNSAGKPRNCYYRRLDMKTGELENMDE